MTDVLFLAILKAKAAGDDRAAAALRALASDPEAFADAVRPPTEEAFAAPGPPPRPGLAWKEETHRWVKPEEPEQPAEKPTKPEPKPAAPAETPAATANTRQGSAKPAKSPAPRVPEAKPSERAARAKAAHKLIGKEVQRYAEEHNEPRFAESIGGLSFKDNEPVDVVLGKGGVVRHGIELKTMCDNGNNKITMKREAMERKAQWERDNNATFHTVVLDDQDVFNAGGPGKHDESKRRIFYRRGFGSFRVGAMHEVTGGIAELKKLMATPDDKLPPAARRSSRGA